MCWRHFSDARLKDTGTIFRVRFDIVLLLFGVFILSLKELKI